MKFSVVSPAPVTGTIDLLKGDKPLSWWRGKAALLQLAQSVTTALVAPDGSVLAVFGLYPESDERATVWFHIRRDAPNMVLPIARVWRLTLIRLPDTRLTIEATVATGDTTGRRLARIAGMTFSGFDDDGLELWEWRNGIRQEHHEVRPARAALRRQRRGGRGEGCGEEAGAAHKNQPGQPARGAAG